MSEQPAWQRGIALERLKAFAAPFAERHKPLVFGAFGLVKERDIAEAMAENRVAWTGPEDAPLGVAIVRAINRDSEHSDFAGRPIHISAPAFVVGAFAARTVEAGQRILHALCALKGATAPLVVEIFEEDEIAKAALAATGRFAYLGTKIMAGSEVKGLYGQGVDYREFETQAAEAATLTRIESGYVGALAAQAIRKELIAGADWAQHYSSYNKRKSWTAFALRGYSDDPLFIEKPAEMSQKWKAENPGMLKERPRWTPLLVKFKGTRKLLERLCHDLGDVEFDRVRFMRLAASKGELSRHADITDRDAGVSDGKVARLHIPITTNPAVAFHGWGTRGEHLTRQFEAGDLFYLDQRKPHAVTNKGDEDRIHLVLDIVANERVRELIGACHAKENPSG